MFQRNAEKFCARRVVILRNFRSTATNFPVLNAIEQKLRFEKGLKTGKLHIFSKKALKILRFDTLVGNQILITMIPFIFIKRVKIVVNKQKCVMLLLSSENRIYSLSRKCFTIFLKYKVVFTYSKNWT